MTEPDGNGVTILGRRIRGTLVPLALGGVLLGVYLGLIGPGALRRALGHVPPRRLVSLVIVGTVPVFFWGFGLHVVLDRLGHAPRPVTSLLLFAASGFLNGITPFGQAGGDPVAAVLFRRALGTDFETGLAAIGSVNALNRVGSVFLGLVGVGYLGSRLAFGRTLEDAALLVAGAVAAALVGTAVAWRYREAIVLGVAAVLVRVVRPVAHWVPGLDAPSHEAVERRGYRFVEAVDVLASAPGRLVVVFAAGLAGQLAVAATLWVALASLGGDPPFAVVLLIIPVAKLAGAAPTPGGFGSAEALLLALIMATTGIGAVDAGAAALLYRAGAFWLPSLVGGLATAWYATRPSRAGRTAAAGADGDGANTPDSGVISEPGSSLTTLLVAVTAALVVLVTVGIHRRDLLFEPESVVVHATRDAAVVVMSFATTWLVFRWFSRTWAD